MNSNQPPKYLANILNSIESAILIVNNEGKIIDCNSAVRKVFDYTCLEIKQKTIYELCAVTPEILFYKDTTIISNGIKKDNTHFFCEISIQSLNNNNKNENETFLFMIADVHERETNKLALQKAIEITATNLRMVMGIV